MAFNITVQSLINAAIYDTYSVTSSTTIGTLKSSIQSATSFDPTWYSLWYNGTMLSNTSATLGSYGITGTVALRSANQIARLPTLEDRQIAKLELSHLERVNFSNPRPYYDITELPTYYDGNVVIDNSNPGGLIEGRPWVSTNPAPPWTLPSGMSLHEPLEGTGGSNSTVPGTTYLSAAASGINAAYGTRGTPYNPGGNVSSVPNSAAGLYREKYVGKPWSTYGAFNEFDIAWFSDPTHGPIGVDIYGYAGFGMRTDLGSENGYALMWRGYVRAPATGTFNWWTAGTDDDAIIWVGTAALSPTVSNKNGSATGDRVLSANSVTLTAGQWYPVRMIFVEFNGAEQCQWFLQDSTHGVLYNGTDLTWAYNSTTKGY
jgi:hypothetical protein